MFAKVICTGCLVIAVLSVALAQASGPRVELSLIVTDKDKKPVNSIRKEDVHVIEDKLEQTVLSVEPDDRPIDYALVIDSSGSLRSQFPNVMLAAKQIIDSGRPSDQFFIERFISSDKIERVQDFTSDKQTLTQALRFFRIEQGQSAVLDGVYVGAAYLAKHSKTVSGRRSVLILISDGEDRNSYTKLNDVLKQLRTEDIQVFVIGLIGELDADSGFVRKSPREKAETLLKTLAEENGGRVFFPKRSGDLADSAAQIVAHSRSRFLITYQSSAEITKPGFRKVEVKLTSPSGEKLNAIAPRGYYVEPKDVQAKPPEKKTP